MKGKYIFTQDEILRLRKLIKQRTNAERTEQKSIRAKMRRIGFYGKDDFGINDLQPKDFEDLIKSGWIKIVGINKPQSVLKNINANNNINNESDSIKELNFKRFDPETDSEYNIPNTSGNYFICLKTGSEFPKTEISYQTKKYENLEVIYTGIAGKSLRKRDYRQHFTGNNAGSSTLRKSLGSLFDYKKIPRDRDPNSGKTKFQSDDEIKLSNWMRSNLILYYAVSSNPAQYEQNLIDKYNPPLNLSKNNNDINRDFRENLSKLRNIK